MTVGSGTALDSTLVPLGNDAVSAEGTAESAEAGAEADGDAVVGDAEVLGDAALCAFDPSCGDHLK
jgi:hypothetical protein